MYIENSMVNGCVLLIGKGLCQVLYLGIFLQAKWPLLFKKKKTLKKI